MDPSANCSRSSKTSETLAAAHANLQALIESLWAEAGAVEAETRHGGFAIDIEVLRHLTAQACDDTFDLPKVLAPI